MYSKRPKNVVMAAAVAVIGGLVSIAFLATALINIDPNSSTFTQAALAMLIAVLFFGFAGQLYPNGSSAYVPVLIIGLINVIAIAVTIIVDIDANFKFGIALFVIAVLEVILVLPSVTEKWIAFDRV